MEYDFVVQRASVFGMRVADQGGMRRVGRSGVQLSLKLAGGAVQEK